MKPLTEEEQQKVESLKGGEIERFRMKVGGGVWAVSINHKGKAVKIDPSNSGDLKVGVVLSAEEFGRLRAMPAEQARATVLAMFHLDGEMA